MTDPVTVKESSILHVHEELPSITAPTLGNIGPLGIATSTITIIFITFLFLWLCRVVSQAKLIPSTFQHLLEMFYELVVSFITSLVGDQAVAKRIVPYVGAILLYLLVSNLLFMIPFLSSFYVIINGEHVQLFRGNTTDFNTTFGLALAVIVILQIVGVREQGFFHYLGHFIKIKEVIVGFKKSVGQGLMSFMSFFVGLVEIISEIAKILSLSLRLFGNMFAHELLTVILLGAFSFFLPVIWMGFGLLVGVVQSVVFISLITVYYSMVLKKDNESH
jgi:F-type H+-transporting ATPase subunit a